MPERLRSLAMDALRNSVGSDQLKKVRRTKERQKAETPEHRSAIMRAVKGRDTTPELAVRRLLRSIAPGYRLHRTDVPGKPDIVYLSRKRAIFVHGCFWHGHDCARGARMPKENRDYWSAKIGRNRQRDIRIRRELDQSGWRSLIIWECEMKDAPAVALKLEAFLASHQGGGG